MGKRQKKRKHSSGTSETSYNTQNKTTRNYSPIETSNKFSSLELDDNNCTDQNVSLSDTLREANLVLFDDSISELNNTVFENNSKSSNSNMTSEPNTEDVMTYLKRIDSKVSQVDQILNKLDSLENKVGTIETEMNKLRVYVYDSIKSAEARIAQASDRVDEIEFACGETRDEITQMQRQNAEMQENLLYLQSQSMRNNLVFGNIEEMPNETNAQSEEKLRSFMKEKLKIANDIVDSIQFERVHRMGWSSERNRCRKIVAKFTLFKDREMVRKHGGNLKGTNYFLHEQFPKEVNDKRRSLLPQLKAAKSAGKKAWIAYDTLYVDGVPMKSN